MVGLELGSVCPSELAGATTVEAPPPRRITEGMARAGTLLGRGANSRREISMVDWWGKESITRVEKKFAVVGVHSAKFDNEKDLDAIRNAVLRYNITHPVVNDGDMYLWRELGVNSWPTFVLIGPNGKVLAQISGEGHRKDLDDVVGAALEFYEEKNLLRNVSTNMVVTNLEGKFICQVGSSDEGLLDGPFDAALFNRPQLSEPAGLVVIGEGRILVADTNNNAIRYITLSEKGADVKTLDLIGVQPPSPKPKTLKRLRRRLSVDTDVLNVDGGSSMEGFLSLAITVPDGYHFSKEARSKFDVETEPANAIEIEPANGFLNSEGLASLKFKRISSSPSMGRINCKVYYCKEDEVCLYQSVAFDVKFNGGAADADPSAAQIALSYSVTPRENCAGPKC
nr:unnamed protein product [Digitaria exilis]